jgi:RND family efflux transporter MFP subunit
VKKGQLLAVIDDEDLQQQIRRAEATIAVARAAVQREEASRKNLEIQLERYRKLHDESLISTQDLEDLESQNRVAVAQLNLATAQVDQAEASVRELKIQQEQTRIYSPLDGFVGTRYLDPGALVSPSVGILMVIDISRVKTVVPVIESAFRLINVGQSARVTVEAYPGKSFSGKVTRISPFLNPETRSADIEIEIDNPSQQLKPGMFAKVSIDAGTPSSSLSVPRSALLTRGNGKGVYLLDEEFRTVFHEIQIGRIQGDFVEVLGGLEEGTEVVTSGAQKLNEGDKVKVA